MEVVISTTPDEVGKLAADAIDELVQAPAGSCAWRRDRIKSLDHLRRTRPPRGAGLLVAGERASIHA